VTNKPLRILSLGAGVQSTTLLYMMVKGEIELPDHVIFSDTGWEPKPVYEHLAKLEELMQQHNILFHKVTAGNIRSDVLRTDGSRVALLPTYMKNPNNSKGMMQRQCTAEYKINPAMKKHRELVGLKPRQQSKEHLGTTIFGISYDEIQRMKDPPFSWLRNEYPLIDMKLTRQMCLDWCEQHGYELPPRSACIGCPFKSDHEWRLLRDTMPDEWQDAVDFDNEYREAVRVRGKLSSIPFLHKSLIPLGEVDLRTSKEKGQFSLFGEDQFDQECEGMCGV
jgi:hypothetical protein